MNLIRYIENIRQKPEHIRKRYVLAGVAISMFFIIIIWLFSLSETLSRSAIKKPVTDFSDNQFNQELMELPSIEEFMQQMPSEKNLESLYGDEENYETSANDQKTENLKEIPDTNQP